jgi:hypothetical protein
MLTHVLVAALALAVYGLLYQYNTGICACVQLADCAPCPPPAAEPDEWSEMIHRPMSTELISYFIHANRTADLTLTIKLPLMDPFGSSYWVQVANFKVEVTAVCDHDGFFAAELRPILHMETLPGPSRYIDIELHHRFPGVILFQPVLVKCRVQYIGSDVV